MQAISLKFDQSPPTPITPPPRLRRKERNPAHLNAAHSNTLLGGRLQERDLNIIRAVWLFGLLTADQIRRLLFYNHAGRQSAQNVMRRRLKLLYDEYCLDRWYFSINSPAVYRLDVQGARLLRSLHGSLEWQQKPAARQLFLMAHTLGVAEFAVSLTEAAREKAGTLDWVGESTLALKLGGDEYFEPDGAGLLRLPNKPPALFFLEWDRATETQAEFTAKIRRYRRYNLTKNWRAELRRLFPALPPGSFPFPPMLVVTTGGRERMVNILKTVGRRLTRLQINPDAQPVFVTTQDLLNRKGLWAKVCFQAGKVTKDDLLWEKGQSMPQMQGEK